MQTKKDYIPFSPGACCFERTVELNVDFGLVESQNSNFLFIPRHLPNSPVSAEIFFRFRPPGIPIGLQFLSESSIVLLTDKANLLCSVRHTDRDHELFDPSNLTTFDHADKLEFNKDYIVMSNKTKFQVLPNPEKSGIDINSFILPTLYSEELHDIQYLKFSNDTLIFITSNKMQSKIITYSIGKSKEIAEIAIDSSDVNIQKNVHRNMLQLCNQMHERQRAL